VSGPGTAAGRTPPPKRELGQHFLVDENILGVIGRLARLAPSDVVLEVGAGLGVLTVYLASRVAHVHAIELDRSLAPHLERALAGVRNVALVFGDALRLPLAALEPPPEKLVANLPYGIATPLCVESLDSLPSIHRWCVMLQREVADRFVARPATPEYGATSVLVQLTCRKEGMHPVSRTCFRPPPGVDSALLALERIRLWGPEYGPLKALVQAAFSHRRKTLANALELSGLAERTRATAALAAIGREATVRAEELAPVEFLRLAEALA
jgi:16S rRNA (adenine1518-N6/adenine1519-N6)-dimethyltransferase